MSIKELAKELKLPYIYENYEELIKEAIDLKQTPEEFLSYFLQKESERIKESRQALAGGGQFFLIFIYAAFAISISILPSLKIITFFNLVECLLRYCIHAFVIFYSLRQFLFFLYYFHFIIFHQINAFFVCTYFFFICNSI